MPFSFQRVLSCAAAALLAGGLATTVSPAAAVTPARSGYVSSGPITLRSGQTVSGLHITNLNGPCITGSGVSNVRITNNRIGPCQAGVEGNGVYVLNSSNIRIDHNRFENVASGLYAVGGSSGGLKFDHNHATRVRGPYPRGQLVQFNGVKGPNHEICCNTSDQKIGGYGSGPEDHINMYNSHGTATSPIRITWNKLRGGGTKSGSGIMLGDNGSSYAVAVRNILVDPGQVGIGISGGHHNTAQGNKIYAARNSWTNVGMYVWKWRASEPPCYSHTVRNNRVNFINRGGVQSPFWNGNNCGPINGISQNGFGDTSIGSAIWNERFSECDGW
jgi:hypothetical protein